MSFGAGAAPGGFQGQSQEARRKGDNNLGGGHGGIYQSAQSAYYTDPKIAKKMAALQEANEKSAAATREAKAKRINAAREAKLMEEQAGIEAKRRKVVLRQSENGIEISASKNIDPYAIADSNGQLQVIAVGGSFASPKSSVTKAIALAKDGYMVRLEVAPMAKPRFAEFVQNQVNRLKLSPEHASRIIVAENSQTQNDKFNADQLAVGNMSEDVRKSVKGGGSADPLKGLE
jgi:hypothetical protein